MVYVVAKYRADGKFAGFYAYRAARLPGNKHPSSIYIGPAKFIDEETAEFRGEIYKVRKKGKKAVDP